MGRHHYRLLPRSRWERLRRQVLRAANWRCACGCGRAAREVDHIRPLDRGGAPWDPANLQALARPCHFAKTRRERGREPTPAESAWNARLREIAAGR